MDTHTGGVSGLKPQWIPIQVGCLWVKASMDTHTGGCLWVKASMDTHTGGLSLGSNLSEHLQRWAVTGFRLQQVHIKTGCPSSNLNKYPISGFKPLWVPTKLGCLCIQTSVSTHKNDGTHLCEPYRKRGKNSKTLTNFAEAARVAWLTASATLPGLWVAVAVLAVVAGLLAVDAPPALATCCTVHNDCQHQVMYNNVSCHVTVSVRSCSTNAPVMS